jgi:hypothetical protein
MRRIIGQVKNGEFISGKPTETSNREHSGHREFVRLSMRDKYARDIEQKYQHGEVNQGYIEAFGKQNAINQGLVEETKYE